MELPETDRSLLGKILEVLEENSYAGFDKALELIINRAMLLERERHLNAGPYERTAERQGHANGFKPKHLKTRVGELELEVPQTRDGFYPKSLEKGLRSERALKLSLAEMYIQGVSTRKVAAITEQLCGFAVSSTQVSHATKELDEMLEKWRNRPLGSYRFLWLDARYEKVRVDNCVVDCAVLIAKGITVEGHREILGVSVNLSEAEVHWRDFLTGLVERGLHGIELITSDDHSGLRAARKKVFPSVAWQRCQFHLQQNAQAYVNKLEQRQEVGESIRVIFNAPNVEEAQRLLGLSVKYYADKNAKLAEWMENNLPEGFTVFKLNASCQKKMRTTNPLERLNKEIKRRSRVVTIFPNVDSCLRLISAVLMETSDEWQSQNRYINLTED